MIMGSIIAAIFSAGVKWLFGCFTPSHDERLGRAEATVEAQNKELKNVELKNRIDNRIDGTDAQRLSADHDLCFRVWAHCPPYMEDLKPWKCIGAFRFLTDALEYMADRQDHGTDSVFQSPADCKPVLASESRVVWKPECKAS